MLSFLSCCENSCLAASAALTVASGWMLKSNFWRAGPIPRWALGQELDLVQQATFTDPEDQSAWVYHRWLLSQLMAHLTPSDSKGQASLQEAKVWKSFRYSQCD